MKTDHGYRQPSVAGYFYPSDPAILAQRVQAFLRAASPGPDPRGLRGLICPHAGYDYSGATAGRAYAEMKGLAAEAVVVLAPSHYDGFHGATVWPGAGYRTPLGDVPHPAGMAEALLAASPNVSADRLGHREEHAAEVQLPFLQEIAPGVPVLPLVFAEDRAEACAEIGRALARVIAGRNVILVASSDLYHGSSTEGCRRTDATTLEALVRNDPSELAQGFRAGRFQACGRGPILGLLEACREVGATRVEVLCRTDSDEVTGGGSGYVVGYAAVAIRPS